MNPLSLTVLRTPFGTASAYQQSPFTPTNDTVAFATTPIRFGTNNIHNEEVNQYLNDINTVYVKLLNEKESLANTIWPFLKLEFPIFQGPDSPLKNKTFSGPYPGHCSQFSNLQAAGVNLEGAKFDYCQLENANLFNANLKNASFIQTWFENADLTEAQLDNAIFYDKGNPQSPRPASIIRCHLKGAKLKYADMQGCPIQKCNMTNANLTNANLSEADLSDTTLERANLKKANFQNTLLDNTDFKDAKIDNVNWRFAAYHRSKPPKNLPEDILKELRVLEG